MSTPSACGSAAPPKERSMWTTSNSHARARSPLVPVRACLSIGSCGLLVLAVLLSPAPGQAPDSPLPADPKAEPKPEAKAEAAPADEARPPSARPVELKSVVARKFRREADPALAK